MKITPSAGKTAQGPADWFTGTVFIDTVRNPDNQTAIGCAHVRFSPGGRTVWHSHPKGQTLYVTDGIGYVSRRGGEVVEIRPGDVVYIEPDEWPRRPAECSAMGSFHGDGQGCVRSQSGQESLPWRRTHWW